MARDPEGTPVVPFSKPDFHHGLIRYASGQFSSFLWPEPGQKVKYHLLATRRCKFPNGAVWVADWVYGSLLTHGRTPGFAGVAAEV